MQRKKIVVNGVYLVTLSILRIKPDLNFVISLSTSMVILKNMLKDNKDMLNVYTKILNSKTIYFVQHIVLPYPLLRNMDYKQNDVDVDNEK